MKLLKTQQGGHELNSQLHKWKKIFIRLHNCQFEEWYVWMNLQASALEFSVGPDCRFSLQAWLLVMTGSDTGASVLSSKWGPADMTGKERNSNQPHNWEIMHTIVVQGRRGPQPAQLFPNRHACCCFCHFEEDRENEKCLHGQFTKHRINLFSRRPLWGGLG